MLLVKVHVLVPLFRRLLPQLVSFYVWHLCCEAFSYSLTPLHPREYISLLSVLLLCLGHDSFATRSVFYSLFPHTLPCVPDTGCLLYLGCGNGLIVFPVPSTKQSILVSYNSYSWNWSLVSQIAKWWRWPFMGVVGRAWGQAKQICF